MKRLSALLLVAFIAIGSSPAWSQPTKMTIGTGVDPSLAQFYVAKEAGIFARNGLDVTLNLGPSGSAMIGYLIGDQINAALGAEQAGIQAHNLDANVAIVGESVQLPHFFGLVARNVDSIEGLKGKKIGIDSGSSSDYVWMNRGWIEKNKAAADAFMQSMVEATAYLQSHTHEAAGQIANLLKLDPTLTETLMGKCDYRMELTNDSLLHMQEIEAQLKQTGKLTKPVDWTTMFAPLPSGMAQGDVRGAVA